MLSRLQYVFSFFIVRYAPAFITLLILAGIFFFYFNVIVSRNEANLKERNFRGLHRMANNMSKKISNYAEKNSQNFFIAWKKSEPDEGIKPKPDSAFQSFIKTEYGLENAPADSLSKKNGTFFIKFSDGWQLLFKDTAKGSNRLASVPIQKFAEPLLRRDLFQYYFLAFSDTILLDELNISNKSVAAYLPGNYATDSVKKGPIIQSGQIRSIEIGGKEFKLFLLPFIVDGKYKFSLGGYIPAESYASQQKYIPTYAILWLVIGLVIVVLMFPLLKVFLMHRSEQLLSRNAVSSLASVHILGSILLLVAINTYVYFAIIKGGVEENLKRLANDIESTFISEVDAALEKMDSAEMVITRTKNLNDRYADSFPSKGYPYSMHISWADSAGQQLVRWSKKDYPSEKINVNDRDYFQAVKDGNLWHREKGKPYYLTVISSWVSEKKMAIISRPVSDSTLKKDSRRLTTMSLSGRFNSMFSPVLPNGFGFCVIQEDGLVLFHMDEKHNSNENLVEECNGNIVLSSLLRSRSAGYFGSTYSGTAQRFYVKPINGMPYYIVTFRDMKSIWSEDLDVISASSILTLMSLAVILLVILVIQAAGYRHSLLQNRSILFTWLQPNRNLKNAYERVSCVYISAIVLQLIFYLVYDGRDHLCQAGNSFCYAYILISCAYYQFTIFSKHDEGKKQENRGPFIILVILYFIIASVFAFVNVRTGRPHFVVFQLSLLLIAYLVSSRKPFGINISGNKFWKFIPALPGRFRKFFGIVGQDPDSYKRWYTRSVFLFISATAVIPSVIFYFLLFKQERLLCLKYCQAEFVNKLLQEPRPGPAEESFKLSYKHPYYFHSFAESINKYKLASDPKDEPENEFESLYKRIKPSFSAYSRQIEFLKNREDSVKELHWSYLQGGDSLLFRYKISTIRAFGDSSLGLSVKSHVKKMPQKLGKAISEDPMSFLLLLVALGLLVWCLYLLLKKLIKRVFFDGYNDPGVFKEFDPLFMQTLSGNKNNKENVFVNGLVNSGKHRIIKGSCNSEKPFEIDIAVLSPSKDTSEEVKTILSGLAEKLKTITDKEVKVIVLISHFEMYMNDLKATERKLSLLESLLREEKVQIIILSSRSFDSMLIKGTTEEKKEIDFTDRWSNVMNQFYTVYHHWTRPEEDDKTKAETEKVLWEFYFDKIYKIWEAEKDVEKHQKKYAEIINYLDDQIDKFFQKLDDECSYSDFLWGIRGSVLNYIKNNKEECLKFDFRYRNESHILKMIKRDFNDLNEQICLKIQDLACKYYLASWQSLSHDDQKTLYDIALDEMVNPANRDIATRLAGLGLIKPLDNSAGYEVMSKSFRNFIFTQLDKKEVISFQNEAAEKGSWRSYQLPILIVIIGLSIFLFTTQKDAFSNLITYLGSAALGIGSLLKLLGAIPSSR
ncbi:MAG TPA: hypothetical protein VIZ28_19885 [Chitinophagaceae bacterium]